jgi:c-di-GMP-binding flagellar brake protein YcgR
MIKESSFQNWQEFIPVLHEEKEILFSQVTGADASVFFWNGAQDFTLKANVIINNQEKNNFTCQINPTKNLNYELKEQESYYFSFSLLNEILFFKTTLIQKSLNQLQFEVRSTIYKIQRRKTIRYELPKSPIRIVFLSHPEKKGAYAKGTICDISAGGINIQIHQKHHELFPLHSKINQIKFDLENISISTSGLVKRANPPRIGIEFSQLPPEDAEKIGLYILHRLRNKLFLEHS